MNLPRANDVEGGPDKLKWCSLCLISRHTFKLVILIKWQEPSRFISAELPPPPQRFRWGGVTDTRTGHL